MKKLIIILLLLIPMALFSQDRMSKLTKEYEQLRKTEMTQRATIDSLKKANRRKPTPGELSSIQKAEADAKQKQIDDLKAKIEANKKIIKELKK